MGRRRADANDVIIGDNIRVHRLSRKLPQSALADAIGISFQQLQKYETGKTWVSAARLVQIAGVLGVPVLTLLAGVPGAGRQSAVGPSAVALLAKAQPLRLVKAFSAIEDRTLRVALVTLAEGIARLGQRGCWRRVIPPAPLAYCRDITDPSAQPSDGQGS
jgi:transcriptional regulator with XRE-family HTH domain